MSRRGLAALLAAAVLGGCEILTPDFHLSGEVRVSPHVAPRAPRSNAVLFIVAANEGGVPLAVHRIVNPEFPARFKMGPADLLVPGIRRNEALRVTVHMNTHGQVGQRRHGDLYGRDAAAVRSGARGLRLLLDKEAE